MVDAVKVTLALLVAVICFFAYGYIEYKQKEELREYKQAYATEKAALELQTERVMFYEQLLERVFGRVPQTVFSTPVTVTAYSAREEETDSEPWRTADLTPSRVGILAVSRDILAELGIQYGDTVLIDGLGLFKVHDTMNKRFRRRVDILMAHPQAALNFGKQEAMLTWIGGQ